MSDPKNLECFNAAAALVLKELYTRFPVPTSLDARELIKDPVIPEECRPTFGTPVVMPNIVSHTIAFLEAEGFIRCTSSNHPWYVSAILTSKGFSALRSAPPEIMTGPTFAERLFSATPDMVGNVLAGILGSFVGK